MRETRADTARATLFAVALHVLLAVLVLAGLHWQRAERPQAAGEPVNADLFDPNALSAQMQRALAAEPVETEPEPLPPEPVAEPPPQPLPEPLPEDALLPPEEASPDFVEQPEPVVQEEVREEALSEQPAEREQEAKRRQEQVDLNREARNRDAQQRRLAELQRRREERIEQFERDRAATARAEALERQRRQQQADADGSSEAAPPPGNRGTDTSLQAQYVLAIQAAVLRQWTRPDNVPLGQRCRLTIRQLPGGEVVSVSFDDSCPYDTAGRRSVEAAILRAQPLPYRGFESVFNRTLNFNFTAQDQ